MAQHHKVHDLLDRAELDKLEAFAREPGRTIDECLEWLQAAGYTISRSAVGRWKTSFDQEDRFSAATEAARSLMSLNETSGKGAADIADAANLKLGQMAFEQLLRMQTDDVVATKDVLGLSMALRNVVATKRGVETVREEMRERQKAALAEAEKAAANGASGEAVARKMRELLGLK